MRNLPFVDIPLVTGENTKFNPISQSNQTLRSAKNVDTFGQFLSLGKVPGSVAVSNNAGSPIRSLHQFEFTDLDFVRKRHQILLDQAGRLRRIESDGSLTLLSQGYRLVPEALVEQAAFDRLFLTSPGQRFLDTGGIKYDGTNVRRWGIKAPGQEDTILFPLTDTSGWTPSADATVSLFGSGVYGNDALRIDKTGTTTSAAFLDKTGLVNFEVAGDGVFFVWLFIPPGALQKLASSGPAAEVVIGDAGLVNADRHGFLVGELLPGWNQLAMSTAAPDSQDGTGATLSAITDIQLRLNFLDTTTTASGFAWNKLFWQDPSTPEVAAGEAGVVSGTVTYRVTYLSENGVESNGGAPSSSVSVTDRKVELTAVPISPDPQTIARRIYRDKDGDRIYRFVAQIDNNVDTTYIDNVEEDSLGGFTIPIAGDDELDSSPPVRFRSVAYANNRLFGVDADNPIIIHVGEVNGPEQFRLIDQLSVDEEIVSLEPHGLGITMFGRDFTFVLTGDGVSRPFRVDLVNTELGANSFRQTTMMRGLNVVQREYEVFLVGDPRDSWFLNGPVYDRFQSLSASAIRDGFFIHDRSRFRMVFFFGSQIHVYQYGTTGYQEITGEGAGTDPLDLRIGGWSTLSLPPTVVPNCAALVERNAERPELWIGCSDGRVYWLQADGTLDYATDWGSSPVEAEIESHPVSVGAGGRLGEGGRGEARYLLLDGYSTAPATWRATVTALSHADGKDLASVSFDVELPGGAAAPVVEIPELGVIGSWYRVKLENSRLGQDGRFKRCRLYYVPRTHFGGSQAA